MGFGSGRGHARNCRTQVGNKKSPFGQHPMRLMEKTASSAHPMSITMVRYGYRVVRPHVRKKRSQRATPRGYSLRVSPIPLRSWRCGSGAKSQLQLRLRGETEACTVPGLPGMAPWVARRHRRHPPSFWLMFVLRCRVGLLMQSASPSWIRTVACKD